MVKVKKQSTMIDKKQCVELLLKEFPEYRSAYEGNEAVSNAAKVGFLEALTNQVKFKKGDVGERFAKYLGEKSKEFCVDLDRFWGTKTI